ncbi:MAG: hypothetical protein RIF46_02385, partial [Cyclobacteriaceae bacterium]
IFYDLGYFGNKNQTDILKVIANSFTTSGSQDISIKSLKAKYYNADGSTKENLKKRLSAAINAIDNLRVT